MAALTAYIFGTKHDIHNRASELKTTRGLLHHLKMSWTLVYKRRRPANGTQPNFAKWWTV